MPKIKVTPRPPDDVPIWDALLVELGDPRPYEPTQIPPSFVVPDDAFVDAATERERLTEATDREFDDALSDLDDHAHYAVDAFDAIWSWPDESPSTEPSTVASSLATVLHPVIGTLDALEQTQELPKWPS